LRCINVERKERYWLVEFEKVKLVKRLEDKVGVDREKGKRKATWRIGYQTNLSI